MNLKEHRMPDILIFISDQHNAIEMSCRGSYAKTVTMDDICKKGTTFLNAYTACPLCVPSRSAFLGMTLPSKTGIFTNQDALSSRKTTFLHALLEYGYETVLVGRMHFVGKNQRHGFTKRLVGDISPTTWNRDTEELRKERGCLYETFGEYGSTNTFGGGDSPVLDYDKQVIDAAIEYLRQNHNKPQCIVVGTYSPHFPYVGRRELYEKYLNKVKLRVDDKDDLCYPAHKLRQHKYDEDTFIKTKAAYYAMIEELDLNLGKVRLAYNSYLKSKNRKGYFLYLSDHGDHVGDRKLFGKMTFYEASARIPFIIEGVNVKKGQEYFWPVSIMDIGPTIFELLTNKKIKLPYDGKSLKECIVEGKEEKERYVISELVDIVDDEIVCARMIRKGKYKLIHYNKYEKYDSLFNVDIDKDEKINLIDKEREIAKELYNILTENWNPESIKRKYNSHLEEVTQIRLYEKIVNAKEEERWIPNGTYKEISENIIKKFC